MRTATKLALLAWTVVSLVFALSVVSYDRPGRVALRGAGAGAANGDYLGSPAGGFRLITAVPARTPSAFSATTVSTSTNRIIVKGSSGDWTVRKAKASILYSAPASEEAGSDGWPPSSGWKPEKGSYAPVPTVETHKPLANSPRDAPKGSVWQRSPALHDLATKPINTCLMAACMAYYVWLWSNRKGYGDVGVSYKLVVLDRQYWRVLSASLAHIDFMHILMNMTSLYSLGDLEFLIGSMRYFQVTYALLFLTILCALAIYHAMARRSGSPAPLHSLAVGYSCILFGVMVMASIRMKQSCPIPFASSLCFKTYHIPLLVGGATLPFNAAPFALLILIQIVIRRASFVGHLSGIIIGYPVAWGLLDWCTPTLLNKCLFALTLALRTWLERSDREAQLRQFAASAGMGNPGSVVVPRMPTDAEAGVVDRLRVRWDAALALASVVSVAAVACLSPLDAADALAFVPILAFVSLKLRRIVTEDLRGTMRWMLAATLISAVDAVFLAISLAAALARAPLLLGPAAPPGLGQPARVWGGVVVFAVSLMLRLFVVQTGILMARKTAIGRAELPGNPAFWERVERDANRQYVLSEGVVVTEEERREAVSASSGTGRMLGGT